MAGSLLIFTGPPGAGKSTVARGVAADGVRPTVHLHTDSFYVWIRAGFVPPYLPEAARQNEVVLGVIAEAACGYARGDYDVVLDGIVGPWALQPFPDAAQRDGLDLIDTTERDRRRSAAGGLGRVRALILFGRSRTRGARTGPRASRRQHWTNRPV
ncbi:AAA family ATPase [Amycolatopsis sp. NPDC058278]|uniref:AAA family ATPase n=1 Tax=Amycolatopsis sp. NPDC058278 TaxID=3346417 RepID=UPI0036DA6148